MPGLSFINKLKPVTYHLDMNQIDAFMNPDKDKYPVRETAKEEALAKETGYNAKGSILETGFLAQDVENAAKELGYDFSGVDVPKNEKDMYGLRYAEFVVPLVKAVQELSQQKDALKKKWMN
ncbi:MAG: tail fiber domain-containing protein [Chitinophagaceae bacterium]|nr:tail fiber domain-containing protein [Chitinophagaceae bacterium]